MGWYCTDTTAVTNTLSFVCRSEEATGSTTKEKRLHPSSSQHKYSRGEVVVHGWKETVPPGSEMRQVSTRGDVHVEPRALLRARSICDRKVCVRPILPSSPFERPAAERAWILSRRSVTRLHRITCFVGTEVCTHGFKFNTSHDFSAHRQAKDQHKVVLVIACACGIDCSRH